MKMTSTYQFATAFTHSPNKLLNAVASQVSVKNLFCEIFVLILVQNILCVLFKVIRRLPISREKSSFLHLIYDAD